MLICNAGVMALPQLQRTTQGFEMQSGVNWLGHVHLVNLLLPRIKEQKVAWAGGTARGDDAEDSTVMRCAWSITESICPILPFEDPFPHRAGLLHGP